MKIHMIIVILDFSAHSNAQTAKHIKHAKHQPLNPTARICAEQAIAIVEGVCDVA